jgi:cell division protein FtsW
MINETTDKLLAQLPLVEDAGGRLLNRTRGDKYIWSIVVLLALTSLLVVYSATGSLAYKMYKGNTEVYLFRQLSFIVLGFLLIYFLHRV